MTDHTTNATPIKLCECGCGQPAPIASTTQKKKGWVKGQPLRYILNHYKRPSRHKSLEEAFWSHCAPGRFDECWGWHGTIDEDGYTKFKYKRRVYLAHRVSWEIHNNQVVPAGLCVCHSCDNRRCTNPAHLWIGTNTDNIADKVQKSRQAKGEQNGRARLVVSDVIEIRHLHASGTLTLNEMAQRYNVATVTIEKIVYRKNWRHIP